MTLPPSTRVYVATAPADMRRSFDGLMGLVRDFLGRPYDLRAFKAWLSVG